MKQLQNRRQLNQLDNDKWGKF